MQIPFLSLRECERSGHWVGLVEVRTTALLVEFSRANDGGAVAIVTPRRSVTANIAHPLASCKAISVYASASAKAARK